MILPVLHAQVVLQHALPALPHSLTQTPALFLALRENGEEPLIKHVKFATVPVSLVRVVQRHVFHAPRPIF